MFFSLRSSLAFATALGLAASVPLVVSADPPVVAPAHDAVVDMTAHAGPGLHLAPQPLVCTFGNQTMDFADGSADLEFTALPGPALAGAPAVGTCGWKNRAWNAATDYHCLVFKNVGDVKAWRDVYGSDPAHGTQIAFTTLPIAFRYGHTFTVTAHPKTASTCLTEDAVLAP